MVDLSTKYLGLNLRNPLVVAASPLCKELPNLRQMEDAGAAAIVLHSLFEEQINIESKELDRFIWDGAEAEQDVADRWKRYEALAQEFSAAAAVQAATATAAKGVQ